MCSKAILHTMNWVPNQVKTILWKDNKCNQNNTLWLEFSNRSIYRQLCYYEVVGDHDLNVTKGFCPRHTQSFSYLFIEMWPTILIIYPIEWKDNISWLICLQSIMIGTTQTGTPIFPLIEPSSKYYTMNKTWGMCSYSKWLLVVLTMSRLTQWQSMKWSIRYKHHYKEQFTSMNT